MATQDTRAVGRGALVAVIVGLMMVAGCSSTPSLHSSGLPNGVDAVGGGLTIDWKAPASGTIYLVERTKGKIIQTKSINEGEVYEFEIDPNETQEFETAVGVPLAEARIVLYFAPASLKSHTP
jgi:hypothetical protein